MVVLQFRTTDKTSHRMSAGFLINRISRKQGLVWQYLTKPINRKTITTMQVIFAAKNSKNAKPKATKVKTTTSQKIEQKKEMPLIPQEQEEFVKYINSYKNEDYYKYGSYSYYDLETEMLPHRQPQPRKPETY